VIPAPFERGRRACILDVNAILCFVNAQTPPRMVVTRLVVARMEQLLQRTFSTPTMTWP